MKLESRAAEVFAGVDAAFEAAVLDTAEEAQRLARQHSRTGKFAASIEASEIVATSEGLEARIGSPLSSAKAKEKGAYITPKRGDYLVFDAGSGIRRVKSVRLRPAPVVTPAGRRFDLFMTRRLKEVFGG